MESRTLEVGPQASLIGLPTELRLYIYDTLLSTGTLSFSDKTSDVTLHFPDKTSDSNATQDEEEGDTEPTSEQSPRPDSDLDGQGILSLLRTHPLIYQELTTYWHSRIHLVFDKTTTFFSVLTTLPTITISRLCTITIIKAHKLILSPLDDDWVFCGIGEAVAHFLLDLKLDLLVAGDPWHDAADRERHAKDWALEYGSETLEPIANFATVNLARELGVHSFARETRFWHRLDSEVLTASYGFNERNPGVRAGIWWEMLLYKDRREERDGVEADVEELSLLFTQETGRSQGFSETGQAQEARRDRVRAEVYYVTGCLEEDLPVELGSERSIDAYCERGREWRLVPTSLQVGGRIQGSYVLQLRDPKVGNLTRDVTSELVLHLADRSWTTAFNEMRIGSTDNSFMSTLWACVDPER